jgi:hypothetical protein
MKHGANNMTVEQQLAHELTTAWGIAWRGDDGCEDAYQAALRAGDDQQAVGRAWRRMKKARRTAALGDRKASDVQRRADAAGVDILDVIALAVDTLPWADARRA